jgi:hypothetical protein
MATEGRKLLFACIGHIDWIVGDDVEVTLFKNENMDDPRGALIAVAEITGGTSEAGRMLDYRQYQNPDGTFEHEIELQPVVPYTEEEAEAEYQRLLRELPDEF